MSDYGININNKDNIINVRCEYCSLEWDIKMNPYENTYIDIFCPNCSSLNRKEIMKDELLDFIKNVRPSTVTLDDCVRNCLGYSISEPKTYISKRLKNLLDNGQIEELEEGKYSFVKYTSDNNDKDKVKEVCVKDIFSCDNNDKEI